MPITRGVLIIGATVGVLAAPSMRAAEANAAEVGLRAELVRPSPKPGWEIWEATDGDRTVIVHVRREDRRLPLVVFATGSHCVPVFFTSHAHGSHELSDRSTLPFDVDAARALGAFQFAVIERKHLESFTTIDDVPATDHCTEEHGGVRKADRAADLALAAAALARQPWVASVIIAGHSEGADVASGAVALLPAQMIAAVGIFAGGGVSQFFDEVVAGRRARASEVSQQAFDDLLAMTGPNPPEAYEGFPATRFQSFAIASTQLDDLVGRDVPVFVVHGTADRNAAPENADAMVVELLRRDPKRAVRYVVLDGADHGFTDQAGQPHAEQLLAELVRWSTDHTIARSVETRYFAPKAPLVVRFLHLPAWLLAALLACIASALLVLSRSGGRLRNAMMAIACAGCLVSAGATIGAWRGIAGASNVSLLAVIGALSGALVSVLALWVSSASLRPASLRRIADRSRHL